ncbi:G2/M phase-specific E3 ubiquitin-protein ligase [Harpegnathos saltator]|uniref:G2/M phase-specific E3 ubiquitin-protein ligase n=1 Tax=Harpegnathos saltator TaxID=610380 RepID=E2BR02_HARSA|nr:G2/M phase-specific E3 ubiquitin-protein ligase [Harpegnathos saltator]
MSATKRNSTSSTTTASSSKVCCFCNLAEDNELEYGKFYEQDGIVTHYYCLLLSSNMEQKGNDDEGILGFLAEDIHKELRRGKKLICSYCKRIGATLGCCNLKCKRIFHFPCGLKAGSLHQFFGEFKSFCVNHRPKQKIDEYVLKQISTLNDILCYICYDRANPKDLMETLWAPCCKKDAWFHRKCVQQLALSAGYFFKCPLCNNKKDFQNAMLQHGIFIPSQDASWELVPNAFEELLYRHDQCDAIICLCPKGRKHTSSNAKWELVLCRICGSQGIHMACGKLKWANPIWECAECTSILCNPTDHENTRSGDSSDSSSLSRDSDTEESDSDISVGTDFPVLCSLPSPSSSSTMINSSFKSRPGPRSFKLQQQLKASSGMLDSLMDMSCASAPISTAATKSTTSTDKVSKENNVQKNKVNDSLQTKKDHCERKKNFSSNIMKSQPDSNKNIIITIESDDDDDVEIIALQRKISIPTVQIAWANMFSSSKPDNSNNLTENSTTKSISEVDPLKTEDTVQSNAKEVSKKCDSIKESNVSISKSKITISKQPDVPAMLKPTQVAISSKNDDLKISPVNSSSVMNIKITNVTSVPPEIFASVPDVGLDKDVTWLQSDTVGMSSVVDKLGKPLDKWFAVQQSSPTTMKRSMHEEGNSLRRFDVIASSVVDSSCKRIRGENSDKTFRNTVLCDTRWEQSQRTEFKVAPSTEIREITENTAKRLASSSTISSPSLNIDQKNDISMQAGTCTPDATYAAIESNHHTKKSDSVPKIAMQHAENGPVKLYTPVIQSGTQIYYSVPSSSIFYTQSISSRMSRETESTTTTSYAMTSNDVVRPPVIHNTATISNRQSVVIRPINIDTVNTNNSQQTKGSCNQQAGLPKEKTTDNLPASNGTSSKIVAGPILLLRQPDVPVSLRPQRLPEQQTRSIHQKSLEQKPTKEETHRDSQESEKTSKDPLMRENPATYNKIKPSIAMQELGERPFSSQTQYEALSSPDHVNNDIFANCLIEDRTEYTADAMAVVIHDDAKENLDPVSRTAPNTVTSSNINLINANGVDATNDTWQNSSEHDAQTCLIRSNINSNALDRAICNTIIDNNTEKDNDRSQNSRVENREGVQRKQFVCNPSTPVAESSWLSHRRTIYSINSDLNIVRTNKNVEKILQNNVTVMTNRHSDDSRTTDNSPTSHLHNFSYVRTNRRKSKSQHSDQTDVAKLQTQDQNVPNIIFNEHSISNRQIGACNSSQLIHCMASCDDENNYDYDDSNVRVSIDLHKIQNLIDSKPELFLSDEEDNDSESNRRRRRCISRLRGANDYTQLQAKFHDTENNDNVRHSSLRNDDLQKLSQTSVIEARGTLYSNANIFNRFRKRERETRYFDKRNR